LIERREQGDEIRREERREGRVKSENAREGTGKVSRGSRQEGSVK
jgi:hypothetical protein